MAQKATHERTRLHNSRLILKTIYEHGEISRAAIARKTRLTRPTVSDVVSELIQRNLVQEVGYAPSTGGKRPMLLSVIANSHCLIGLDLARDDFRGALINLRGEIKHRITLPLNDRDGDTALNLVYELVDTLHKISKAPLLGIGIGTPGLVDAEQGIMHQSINLNWRNVPMRTLLQERYNLPVYIANDCQMAALAEYTFGDYQGAQNLVVINMGRGVGAGIILNGQVLHGNPVGAGEIGHIVVAQNGKRCQCGNSGCLETIVKPQAIIQSAQAIAQNERSLLSPFARIPEAITFDLILEKFQAGDMYLDQLLQEIGQSLGVAAANLVGVLGGCHILLNGPVTGFGRALLDIIQEEIAKRTLTTLAQNTEIDFVSLGSDIVLLGTAALLLTNELGVF